MGGETTQKINQGEIECRPTLHRVPHTNEKLYGSLGPASNTIIGEATSPLSHPDYGNSPDQGVDNVAQSFRSWAHQLRKRTGQGYFELIMIESGLIFSPS